jgi:hypothetical protein
MTRLALPLTVLLFVSLAAPSVGAADVAESRRQIVGTWRGTSSCLHPAAACGDEEVLYEISSIDPDAVLLRADKIAAGQRSHMYDATFHYDPLRDRWTSELRSARTNAVWSYTVAGDVLRGALQDTKTREQMRRVDARRQH